MSVLLPEPTPVATNGRELTRTTDSAFEVVTVDELKESMRLRTTAHDAVLGRLIKASRQQIERMIEQALIKQIWQQTANRVPREIKLLVTPVLSVSSVEYIPGMDSDTWLTYDSSNYAAAGDSLLARTTWPTHRNWKSLRVTFAVGYNDHPDSPTDDDKTTARDAVPSSLREAVRELAAHMFENPEGTAAVQYETVAKQFGALPGVVKEIISGYIKWGL